MKKQLTKEEQLINFFIEKFENENTNEISIYRTDISKLSISEQEAARTIHLLQEDGLVRIKDKSPYNDFRRFWVISLKSPCIHYFENRMLDKKSKVIKLFNEVRAWATLIIALIALIHSIYTTGSKSVSLHSADFEVVPSVSDNQVHIP